MGVLILWCVNDIVALIACLQRPMLWIEEVAIKLECVKAKHPQLHIEAKFYKMVQCGGGSLMYLDIRTT